jgi:hypothetical protein
MGKHNVFRALHYWTYVGPAYIDVMQDGHAEAPIFKIYATK